MRRWLAAVVTLGALSALPAQAASAPSVSVFSLGGGFARDYGATITAGPDGNLWARQWKRGVPTLSGEVIARLNPTTGRLAFYAPCVSGRDAGYPNQLVPGPGRSVWAMITALGQIDRIAPSGRLSVVARHLKGLSGITPGPGGRLWFVRDTSSFSPPRVGWVSTRGQVMEFRFPSRSNAFAIAAGSDGNLWVTREDGVWRITPAGAMTPMTNAAGLSPLQIAAGPDGNLWGAGIGDSILRLSPTGTATTFPLEGADGIRQLVAGPDGSVWFFRLRRVPTGRDTIGWVTAAGTVTEFPSPIQLGDPYPMAKGPDGNMWLIGTKGQIARINLTHTARRLTFRRRGPRVAGMNACPLNEQHAYRP
jgi:streptogramin lyase